MQLQSDQNPVGSGVAMELFLYHLIKDTDPSGVKYLFHVLVPLLLYLALEDEWITEVWDRLISVLYGLSNLSEVLHGHDVVEVDCGHLLLANLVIDKKSSVVRSTYPAILNQQHAWAKYSSIIMLWRCAYWFWG